ncbi:hypothetical protein [Streptomyces sp. NPDC005209]|uniref:hypothetical protein n=1 Tax=Streptomyces sp. NPDC005209 TaxID=3156715 RepID=UPI0033B3B086
MPVTVHVTPLAKQQVADLRRAHRAAYDQFLSELRSQGCRALGYRLTGDVVEHLCVKHLVRALRVVVAFTAKDEATIVIVGPHDDDDPHNDVYTLLYELAGLERPPQGERTKPPCCGTEDGLPPLADQSLADDLVSRCRDLTRAGGRRAGRRR